MASDGPSGNRSGDWQCPNGECYNHTAYPQAFVFGSKVNCPKCGTGKSASRPGDWCCPNPGCANHQNCVYASKTQCTRCGAARPPLSARGGAVPNASPHLVGGGVEGGPGPGGRMQGRMGDWHCPEASCKNHTDNLVFGSKSSCPICGTAKPAPPPGGEKGPPPQHSDYRMPAQFHLNAPNARQGDWHCANADCKNHTDNVVFGRKSHCPLCGTEKPALPPPGSAPGPVGFQGYGPAPQVPQYGGPRFPNGPSARSGDWHCPNSGCKNHSENVVFGSKGQCPICGTPKPDDGGIMPPAAQRAPLAFGGGGGGGGGYGGKGRGGGKGGCKGGKCDQVKGQPGDWHCSNSDCKNHRDNVVYASKTSCPVCGMPKPTDDLTFASSSRPGDWQCPNSGCRNHVNGVYATKPMCTLCGEANPNLGLAGGARSRSRSPRQFE